MDSDLTIMIYGAIMGVIGSIASTLVTTIFQLWLERRENDRRQREEQSRQLKRIHLPTDEEVMTINASRSDENESELKGKAAETGSVIVSVCVGGALVYQTSDPLLGFTFSAFLGFLLTSRVIRSLGRN